MIEEATREASSSWPASIRDRVALRVGDCTKPLIDLESEGPFDLVFGAWLLNYASTAAEQLGMWRNIYANLRPGGLFIGVTPNVHMDPEKQPVDDRYGYALCLWRELRMGGSVGSRRIRCQRGRSLRCIICRRKFTSGALLRLG